MVALNERQLISSTGMNADPAWPNHRIFQKLEIEFLGDISQFSSVELLKIIFFQNFLSANIVGQIKHLCTELYSQAKAYLCHVRKIIVSKR